MIRRLYLDLTGLPPSPDDARAFVADRSAQAVEKVVDRLLASPHYGERWARHWLDVVRDAETNGYERDGDKPHAWRYRDYVIDAFNEDKPYDRFLTEQLAGDEVEGSNAASQIATTFLRLGTWDDEPAEPLVDRYDQLDDVLGTAATAFMGITLRCARCHDHKFEPFSQRDYYRMLAVFEPLKRPQNGRTDLDCLVGTEPELAAYYAAIARADSETAQLRERIESLLRPEVDALLAERENVQPGKPAKIKEWVSDAAAAALRVPTKQRSKPQLDAIRPIADRLDIELRRRAPTEVQAAMKPLDDRLAAIRSARPIEPPRAYIWTEPGTKPPVTRIFKRGDPAHPGTAVEPGVPAILTAHEPPPPKPTARTTGRRLWLARWLTDPGNPLVARVIVNRVWQAHFGEGLVSTANDFGVMGDSPSHPELLDWLASEFVASGWRLKSLHRLIVLSQTYQRSSSVETGSSAAQASPSLLARWRPRRLEAEVIRDSILFVSGDLNPRAGGPSYYPELPRAVLEGQSRPGEGWGKSTERESSSRSIYAFTKRALGIPELELLDTPDTTGSCERRMVSTTGPQALTFLNGQFIQRQSRRFASRLAAEAGDDPARQIERAFLLALSRRPSEAEFRAASEFLDKEERQIESDRARGINDGRTGPASARRQALEAFCLVVLNMNEFVYLD